MELDEILTTMSRDPGRKRGRDIEESWLYVLNCDYGNLTGPGEEGEKMIILNSFDGMLNTLRRQEVKNARENGRNDPIEYMLLSLSNPAINKYSIYLVDFITNKITPLLNDGSENEYYDTQRNMDEKLNRLPFPSVIKVQIGTGFLPIPV